MASSTCFTGGNDGIYRAFIRSCKTSITENDSSIGPTVAQFVGSLLGVKKECNLHESWGEFASKFPDHALLLRRSAAEFRAPNGSKFQVQLLPNQKVMTKRLFVSNPEYEDGMPKIKKPRAGNDNIGGGSQSVTGLGKIIRKRTRRVKTSNVPNKSPKLDHSAKKDGFCQKESSEHETTDGIARKTTPNEALEKFTQRNTEKTTDDHNNICTEKVANEKISETHGTGTKAIQNSIKIEDMDDEGAGSGSVQSDNEDDDPQGFCNSPGEFSRSQSEEKGTAEKIKIEDDKVGPEKNRTSGKSDCQVM